MSLILRYLDIVADHLLRLKVLLRHRLGIQIATVLRHNMAKILRRIRHNHVLIVQFLLVRIDQNDEDAADLDVEILARPQKEEVLDY